MTNQVVISAEQFSAGKTAGVHENIVDVADLAFEIGLRNDVLAPGEGEFDLTQ